MNATPIERAWSRNQAWVQRRYPDLKAEEIEVLRALEVIPLPSGEILVGPRVLLALHEMIVSLNGRLSALHRGRKAKDRDPEPQPEAQSTEP